MAKMRSWDSYKRETDLDYKLTGKLRDFNRVAKLYEKKRLYVVGNLVTENLFEQLRTAIRIISEIYENQWDINFVPTLIRKEGKSGKGYNAIAFEIKGIRLLFESITIKTTSGGRGHHIKDLLVEIPFSVNRNNLTIGRLKGGRLTMTQAEWQSHYFHSHLDTRNGNIIDAGPSRFPYLKSFCTGSGEINIYQQNINGDGLNEARFTAYAMQIMSLVTHESTEGHPYRTYRSISARPTSGRNFSTPGSSLLDQFYRYIINFYKQNPTIKPNVNISFNTQGMYALNDDETYTNFITQPFTIRDSQEDYRRYWCIVGENGNYFQYNDAPGYAAIPDFSSYKTIFRGVERTFEVEVTQASRTPLTNTIHPNFVKHFKTKLEYELNKKRITESTVNRYKNQNSNARESTEASPVPM